MTETTEQYDVGAGVPEGTNLWEFARNTEMDLIETRQQVRDLERRLEVLAASQVTPADVARLQDQQLGSALESSAFLVELRRIAEALEHLTETPRPLTPGCEYDCDELWRLARAHVASWEGDGPAYTDHDALRTYVREHMTND